MTEHIKMPDVIPVVRYLADGTEDTYSFSFPIFASEDIGVFFNGAPQNSGFAVTGEGETEGGTVVFDTAPAAGLIVTIERRLPLERMTDFLEGGDFSARAINNELDYITATVQQVKRDQSGVLRYPDTENPSPVAIPGKALRANKALGFNNDGDPVAVSLEGSMAAPDFTATGTGAETRTSSDKFGDFVSVKDFGAAGDGLTDDTLAFQQALAAHYSVHVPEGTYIISDSIEVTARRSLLGAGQASVIHCQSDDFPAIVLPGGFSTVLNLRIEGGEIGIKMYGRDGECVQNTVRDVQIDQALTGIELDGYNDGTKPCYWNNVSRVMIQRPMVHGVHLRRTGAGDTPNANRFYDVRVYSKGAATTGSGFYIEAGQLNNSFIDCEANVNGTAAACFRLGADSSKTIIQSALCEGFNSVPNIQLDAGSEESIIVNLTSMSNGPAIYDLSGGQYEAYASGYPYKNRLKKTSVTDLIATLMRMDTEFISTAGTTNLDLSHSVHIVNASLGAITVNLPAAGAAEGAVMTVKKNDASANIVSIGEQSGGPGPDGGVLQLGGQNDYVTAISNGAAWFVICSNRSPGNTRFADTSGTYDIDMAVDTYLLSSFAGALTARLPPANAVKAVGRTITIKKTDSSANAVTVTEQGGAGPDQSSQVLSDQYDAITVVSNGANWFVVSRY